MDKKQAIREFKERKVPQGVYAIRCTATGKVWVDAFSNLDSVRNRDWFSLRHGGHLNRALQAEWNTHGEPAFQFEILEVFDEGLSPLLLRDLLKQRKLHWMAQLGASAL